MSLLKLNRFCFNLLEFGFSLYRYQDALVDACEIGGSPIKSEQMRASTIEA